jgi:predicted aldo/keto reductase-like oxidoreductase
LRADYVDVYHLHAIRAEHYDQALAELVPAMLKLRDQGKIRFLGVTEPFVGDTRMFARVDTVSGQ